MRLIRPSSSTRYVLSFSFHHDEGGTRDSVIVRMCSFAVYRMGCRFFPDNYAVVICMKTGGTAPWLFLENNDFIQVGKRLHVKLMARRLVVL